MANRLPSGRRQAPAQSAPPRAADIGDNSMHGEEAERVALITYISKLTAQQAEIDKAKAPFDAAKKAMTQTFRLAKAAGFLRKDLERRLEEMSQSSADIAQEAVREAKHRKWLGILDEENTELILSDKAPQEVKDAAHWSGAGYRDGLRMKVREAPKECHARFLQDYLKGHDKGFHDATLANAPKPIPLSPAEQAKADFEADQAEAEAVDKAARALKNDPTFMDRSVPDDEFEASESELSQQLQRQAVVGDREDEPV